MVARIEMLAALLLAGLVLAAVALAADAPARVDLSRYKSRKSVSAFDHRTHTVARIECRRCHHQARDGKLELKCSLCHQRKAGDGVLGFKDAFHELCKGCHERSNKKQGTRAPTRCSGCHL